MRGRGFISGVALAALAGIGMVSRVHVLGDEPPRQRKTTHVEDPADVPSRQVRRKLERQAQKRRK